MTSSFIAECSLFSWHHLIIFVTYLPFAACFTASIRITLYEHLKITSENYSLNAFYIVLDVSYGWWSSEDFRHWDLGKLWFCMLPLYFFKVSYCHWWYLVRENPQQHYCMLQQCKSFLVVFVAKAAPHASFMAGKKKCMKLFLFFFEV